MLSNTVLAGETPLPKSRSPLVYKPEVDEAETEDLWLEVVQRTSHWPAVAAAAVAWEAWLSLNLYPRLPWLGLILAGAILRARGLTAHLLPLAAGFKQARLRPRGRAGALETLEGFYTVVEEAVVDRQPGPGSPAACPRADGAGDQGVPFELQAAGAGGSVSLAAAGDGAAGGQGAAGHAQGR